jgi:hypothetical protein
MQYAKWYVPWKIANGAENLVLQVLLFQEKVICRKLPGGASINHYTPNECFVWKVSLMLALRCSLLIMEYTLINVLKVLALIISMYRLHVSFLLKITLRYFALFRNRIFHPFNV